MSFTEEALLEWAVCERAIADMFQDLPDIDENDCYQFHHEVIIWSHKNEQASIIKS